jgi:phenylacetate-CoA ligase
MVRPGQKVLILMPGDRPASVGDLLVKALHRMNVEGIVHGIVQEPLKAIQDIVRYGIDCLVGIPAQLFSIARHPRAREIPSGRIKSVLLSADHAPSAIIRELRRVWGCPVFNHYGTTEMGLGGGVECEALSGYHLREADLYFEIVDPDSGRPEPPGTVGEVVFTTLTRSGMPLIRYRTGDLARFEPEACACGTVLRRMETIAGRLRDKVRLRTGDWLGISDLDEALFPLPSIMNYSATLSSEAEEDVLAIEIYPVPDGDRPDTESVRTALLSIPQLASAAGKGCLRLELKGYATQNWVSTGVDKRAIGRSRLKEYHSG